MLRSCLDISKLTTRRLSCSLHVTQIVRIGLRLPRASLLSRYRQIGPAVMHADGPQTLLEAHIRRRENPITPTPLPPSDMQQRRIKNDLHDREDGRPHARPFAYGRHQIEKNTFMFPLTLKKGGRQHRRSASCPRRRAGGRRPWGTGGGRAIGGQRGQRRFGRNAGRLHLLHAQRGPLVRGT